LSEADDTITVVDLLNDVTLENIEQTELGASRGNGKLGSESQGFDCAARGWGSAHCKASWVYLGGIAESTILAPPGVGNGVSAVAGFIWMLTWAARLEDAECLTEEFCMPADEIGRWIGALIVGPLLFVVGLISVVFRKQMARSAKRGADEVAKEDLPRWIRAGNRSPASATAFLVTGILMMVGSSLGFLYALLHVV
jgi:hypothetical protein